MKVHPTRNPGLPRFAGIPRFAGARKVLVALVVVLAAGALLTSGGVAAGGPAPTISGFTPSSAAPGASVTITGTSFTGATAVAFNGTAATYTVASDTQINATVPSGASTGPITVTTPNGTASSAAATVSFVSVGTARVLSGTTSLGLALPPSYQAGDLLVAWLSFGDNAQSITGMTGWTEFPWSPLDDGVLWHARAFYKIVISAETAPMVHWTNNTKPIFETGAWRGVSATSPIVASGGALDLASSVNVNTPAVTNSLASAWAIAFFAFRTTTTANNNTTFSSFTPAGLTKRADANLSGAASASWENVATADSAGAIAAGSHYRLMSRGLLLIDSGRAPDLTALSMANDDAGKLTWRIGIANRSALAAPDLVFLVIDADWKEETGSNAFEYLIQVDPAQRPALAAWNGSEWRDIQS